MANGKLKTATKRPALKPRKMILIRAHYEAAGSLNILQRPEKGTVVPSLDEKRRAAMYFRRLAKTTGVDITGMNYKDAYLACVRALIEQTGQGTNDDIKGLQHLANEYARRCYERRKEAEVSVQQAPVAAKEGAFRIPNDYHGWESFGFLPDDIINYVAVTDPRPGEVVFLKDGGTWYAGRFVEITEENGKKWWVYLKPNDEKWLYTYPAPIYRVVSITRTTQVERPDEQAAPGALSPATLARIEKLRKRLDKLFEPEQERAYFKTLREIWDLEHPIEVADEWPDVIAA